MMNSVPAGVRGRSSRSCPENAELVEFGQPLFRVEPDEAVACSFPTAARSRCGSCAPAASWSSRAWSVTSEVDRDGLAARSADRAVVLGPGPATQSYLRDDVVVQAALGTGCDAIHPGYGFLSESPRLAARSREHGLVFVGPAAGGDGADRGQAEGPCAGSEGRPAGPPRPGGAEPSDDARKLAAADRLSGAGQGRRGRWRPRHQAGARRRRARRRSSGWPAARPARRSATSASTSSASLRQHPPRRGSDRGRRARGRYPSRRARLLGAAPLPEGDRGSPRAVSRRTPPASRSRAAAVAFARRSATATLAPSSSSSIPTPAISSSSRSTAGSRSSIRSPRR